MGVCVGSVVGVGVCCVSLLIPNGPAVSALPVYVPFIAYIVCPVLRVLIKFSMMTKVESLNEWVDEVAVNVEPMTMPL